MPILVNGSFVSNARHLRFPFHVASVAFLGRHPWWPDIACVSQGWQVGLVSPHRITMREKTWCKERNLCKKEFACFLSSKRTKHVPKSQKTCFSQHVKGRWVRWHHAHCNGVERVVGLQYIMPIQGEGVSLRSVSQTRYTFHGVRNVCKTLRCLLQKYSVCTQQSNNAEHYTSQEDLHLFFSFSRFLSPPFAAGGREGFGFDAF